MNDINDLNNADDMDDIDNDIPQFETIYTIKTEQIIYYVNMKDKTFCDTIIICCCKDKTFNVFFELDKTKPYFGINANYNIRETTVRNLYENTTI
jgi:hypothetical protein